MMKQLLNSVIQNIVISISQISYLPQPSTLLRPWQIIDQLATDKSRYFAKPRPIFVNYRSMQIFLPFHWLKAHHMTYK